MLVWLSGRDALFSMALRFAGGFVAVGMLASALWHLFPALRLTEKVRPIEEVESASVTATTASSEEEIQALRAGR